MTDRIELGFKPLGTVTEITLPGDFGCNCRLLLRFENMLARAAGGYTAWRTFGAWREPFSDRVKRADAGQVTYQAAGLADADFKEILRFILSETLDRAVYVVLNGLGHTIERAKATPRSPDRGPDLTL